MYFPPHWCSHQQYNRGQYLGVLVVYFLYKIKLSPVLEIFHFKRLCPLMCGYSRMNFVMQCIYTLTINFIPNGYYCGFPPYNYTESYSVLQATYHTETRESLRLTFLC